MFSEFTHLLALNIAITSVGICTAALCVSWLWTSRSLPLQYGLLLSAVILAVVCPLPLLLSFRQGVGLLNISVAPHAMHSSPSKELPHIVQDSSAQPVVSHSQPSTVVHQPAPPSAAADTTTGIEPQLDQASQTTATPPASAPGSWRSSFLRTAEALLGGWPDMLIVSWLMVSLVLAARLMCGLCSLRFLHRSLHETADFELMRAANDACTGVANFCTSRLRESKLVSSPLTVGFFRPMIVVPENLSSALSKEQLTGVLAHELAHVMRRDTLAACLQSIATVVFWWNPAVLLANRRLRVLREQICDDYVVNWFGTGRALAEAMVTLAERSLDRHTFPSLSPRFLTQQHETEKRVARLVQTRRSIQVHLNKPAWMVIAGFCAASLSLFIPVLQAQVVPSESPEQAWTKPAEGRVSIGGCVQDRTGAPIPKADVWLAVVKGQQRFYYSTTSDARGEFRFENVEAGSLTLTAKSPQLSFAVSHVYNVEPGRLIKGQILELTPPRELKVIVTDEEGQRLAGASIASLRWKTKHSNWCWLLDYLLEKEGVKPAQSDQDGMIAFTGIPADAECIVQISHPDFAKAESPAIDINASPTEIALERGSPLFIEVRDDATDQPVPDATIRISGIAKQRQEMARGTGVVNQTVPVNAEGKVTVRLGRSEMLSIHAEHPVLVSPRWERIDRWEGPTDHRIEFRMKRKGRVRGRVVDAKSHEPANGATVGLVATASQYFTRTRTDPDGFYEITGPVGYVELSVQSDNGYYAERNQRTSAMVIADDIVQPKGDLQVMKLPLIKGQVLHDGKPCKNAIVAIGNSFQEPVLTDNTGQFQLQMKREDESLFLEANSLSEKLSGAQAYTFEEALAEKELVIQLQPESDLVGQVTGQNAPVVAGRSVHLHSRASHNGWSTGSYLGSSPVDASGRYRFTGLSRARSYRVSAQQGWDSTNHTEWITPDKSVVELPPLSIPELATEGAVKSPLGQAATELNCRSWLNSRPLSLASLRGKVVLIEFWGTWCGPCVAEMPKLQAMHEALADKGLVIIGVHDNSADENEVQQFLKNRGVTYPIAIDNFSGQTCGAYDVQSFPTAVLIDRKGNIVDASLPRDAALKRARSLVLYEDE